MKIIVGVLLLLCVSAGIAHAQQRMDSTYFYYLEHKKSPGVAFCLSFLLPGGGQLYNGDAFRFLIVAPCVIGGPILAYKKGFDDKISYYMGQRIVTKEMNDAFIMSMGVAVGVYIYSHFDAPASSSNKNRAMKRRLNISATGDKVFLSYKF